MGHMRDLAQKRETARTSFQKTHEAHAAAEVAESKLQFIPIPSH